MKGKVTMFKPGRGYGFVCDESGESYFVHQTNIIMSGFRYLERGQEVTFEVGERADDGRKQAIKVRVEKRGEKEHE